MKLSKENILTLPVSKEDRKLLISLCDDIEEINRISGLELYIDWQDFHDEYSVERTDPCPDYYGYYSIRTENGNIIGSDPCNIQDLDETCCSIYSVIEELQNKELLKNEVCYYECGKGWWPLIEEAKRIVNTWNKEHPNKEPIRFHQIKEKYGQLRLYLSAAPREIWDKMDELEEKSYSICEYCGSTENVDTREIRGWIYTVCDECAKELETKTWNELNYG